MKAILDYLHSIQYEIGDLTHKVEELTTTQKEQIEHTNKELRSNQNRIKSINNKVVEMKKTADPLKNEIEKTHTR